MVAMGTRIASTHDQSTDAASLSVCGAGRRRSRQKVCPSERSGKACKSTNFDIVDNSRVVSDHQTIKIQEQVSKLGVGSIPRAIVVVLEDDLVDSVKAGDHVVVVGILMRCWRPCIKDIRCDLETIVKANSIRITNATAAHVLVTEELKSEFAHFWTRHARDPMRARNEIVASICPKVYGLFVVKLGVALTVVGGCTHVNESGMRTRGEPHMLLIGDPGTGKSQFLRFTAELSPRSVLTTGIGTTSAGLTCTAVKDGGEWMLEAGALVLADRGVCCIDEFSSIRSHDRTSIHEAMEQQTLSVAKAGLVCKLNARTTVFAVTNPKGRYDPNADVSVNTAIGSPLLSRFDLVLVLLDRMNPRWDEVVSAFILQQSTERADVKREARGSDSDTSRDASATSERDDTLWPIPKLQAYICYVKDKYQPQLSRSAMLVLQRYYQLQRSSDTRSAARTTIRLLESLTRLAQAHARLMCHDDVQVMDAVVAVFVMEVSRATDCGTSMLGGGGGLDSVLHSDFAEDPATEYALQEKMVLEQLGLPELATSVSSSGHSSSQSHNHSQRHRSVDGSSSASFQSQSQSHASAPSASQRPHAPSKRWLAPPDTSSTSSSRYTTTGNGGEYGDDQDPQELGRKRQRGAESSSSASQQVSWSQRLSGALASRLPPHAVVVGSRSGSQDNGHDGHDGHDGAAREDRQQGEGETAATTGASRSRFAIGGKWSQSSQSITSKWRRR